MSGLLAVLMAFGCTSSPADPTAQAMQGDVSEPTPDQVTKPGQVTDLIVTDSSGTSRTLSFTQVDDGTGHAADYAVRFQIGPMNWGSAADVVYGSCAAPVQGTSIGSRMSCTVDNLVPENTYTFQVAAFRGTFRGGAVYGELSNVVPDMGSGSHPNEPAGLTRFAEHDLSCKPGQGCARAGLWKENANAGKQTNHAIEEYNDAPQSKDAVFRYRYPANLTDGVSPAGFYAWDEDGMAGEAPYSEVYLSFWIKIKNSDFENQSVGTKIFGYMSYGKTDRRNQFFMMMRNNSGGKSAVENSWDFWADFTSEYGGLDYGPNQGRHRIFSAGEWHHIEMYHQLSGDRTNDGMFQMWIDGLLYMDHRDVNHRDSTVGATRGFYQLHWVPVWGGNSGDTRSRDDDVLVDHIYISGRRQ